MRLFIGIPLAAQVVEELSAICQRLRSDHDGLRWSSPESWHITLQFLGEANGNQYDCFVPPLRGLKSPGISIRLERLDFFDRVGVFFAGVEVSPELALLQRHVTAATAQCGFVADARPYRPHVTLARVKGNRRGHSLRELKSKAGREPRFTSFIANEFLLYEAFLSPAGSRYEVRERFVFASPGD
jgi:RNA 2',3'-cyclic 3'-phosphodiesterase